MRSKTKDLKIDETIVLQPDQLPPDARLEGYRNFVVQVPQNHVTQGRLLEELREWGLAISAGQISSLRLEGHDDFHAEKDELLPVAREISDHLHCDDTSARHM